MKKIATIFFIVLVANISLSVELPSPFVSYETTSTGEAGVNSTAYTWNVRENGISGGIYAGRTLLSSLQSSASFRFDGVSGTLKFKCIIYAAGQGCIESRRSCAWFTGDELINDWTGSLDGNSYKENLITCHFPNAGTHKVNFSMSMMKQASKYYVQGPRLEIRDIEWLPDYVDAAVDGDALRIEGDWIRQNISSNVLYDCRYDYSNVLDRVEVNGYTVLDSYIAGLTPTNSNSKLLANIHMVDDNPVITWEPNIANRVYAIYGKANLTDKAWHSPTNALDRFFKIEVEMK
jgi:hypothetical protein